MNNLSDSDIGLLFRSYWSKGGGARGSKASQSRLIKMGYAIEKPININMINEQIFGNRINITEKGKDFILKGK